MLTPFAFLDAYGVRLTPQILPFWTIHIFFQGRDRLSLADNDPDVTRRQPSLDRLCRLDVKLPIKKTTHDISHDCRLSFVSRPVILNNVEGIMRAEKSFLISVEQAWPDKTNGFMSPRKLVPLAALVLGLIMVPALARATAFTYTDVNGVLGSQISYDLHYSLLSGATYSGTLTITSSGNTAGWYADSILLKPEAGSKLEKFSPVSHPSANWTKYTENGGFYGFSVTGFSADGFSDYKNGIDLSNATSPAVFTFQFTLKDGETLNLTGPSLKVVYFNSTKKKGGHFNQLSEEFTPASPTSVPEPASILLVLSGLLGMAAFRRKFKK